MNRILATIGVSLLALALSGCPDSPTDSPTSDNSKWEMTWEFGDSTACPTEPVSGDFHWAIVSRGTDTISITMPQAGVYMAEATGVIETMDLRGLGKCPDPPNVSWSEIVVAQQPTPNSRVVYVSARALPLTTPTQLIVNTSGLFQIGLGSHRTLPLGSDTNEPLGDGVFGFDARFQLPLKTPDAFDSTWSFEQGGTRTFRVHAALRKIP